MMGSPLRRMDMYRTHYGGTKGFKRIATTTLAGAAKGTLGFMTVLNHHIVDVGSPSWGGHIIDKSLDGATAGN